MIGRPWKGTSVRFLPLLLGLAMWALIAGSASAEMASYAEVAKASGETRLQIARGEEASGSQKAESGVAVISDILVEQASPVKASIVIQADRSLQSYESFALPDPPRLVVDIPNAQHAVLSYPSVGANTLLKKIRSSQYKDAPTKIVRIVFDLTSPSSYQVDQKENQLRISLGEGEKSEVASSPATPASTELAAAGGRVTKIDYQSQKGKGRLLISTEGKVKYDLSRISQPPSLVLDIRPAEIVEAACRPLDVRLLPGQVNQVRATQSQLEPEKVVRVVADLKGMVKYEISQDYTGISVDIIPSSP